MWHLFAQFMPPAAAVVVVVMLDAFAWLLLDIDQRQLLAGRPGPNAASRAQQQNAGGLAPITRSGRVVIAATPQTSESTRRGLQGRRVDRPPA